MGCADCQARLDKVQSALADEERYSSEVAGALARVNELVTNRATDPTPLGAKELDLMVAIRDVLHDLVQPVVSRETEKPNVQEETVVADKVEVVAKTRRTSGASNPQVNRASTDGLGNSVQSNAFRGLHVGHRSVHTNRGR